MKLLFATPTPLAYFSSLVQSDADFPLLEAAISLAQDEDPDLDIQNVLGEVDQLLARLKRRIAADAGPLQKLRALNQFLYHDLGFGGNVNDYHDPDNSYIHVVLQTRRAIPVTLAVIWLELAQGLGLSARGICFPGHFMVKARVAEGQIVMDPLDGQSLSRDELIERLEPLRPDALQADDAEVPLGLFLQVASSRDIIARMLLNLKEVHASQADWMRVIAVQNRLLTLLPQDWGAYRDRGLAHAEVGHAQRALIDLETYLAHAHGEVDLEAIALRVAELRRTCR